MKHAVADVLADLLNLLPAGIVDAIYLAIERELHLAAAAIATLMLATSLALGALLGRAPRGSVAYAGRKQPDLAFVPGASQPSGECAGARPIGTPVGSGA